MTGTPLFSWMAEVDRPLVAALEQRGATVHAPLWHEPAVDWEAFDVAVVRTAWDYPDRRAEFVDWAVRAGASTRLWNPPDVLRWNTHKSYLLELEDRGAPVVPSAWLGQGDRIDLGELLRARGWTEAVIKPTVASGSSGLLRVTAAGSTAVVGAGRDDLAVGTTAAGTAGAGRVDLATGQRHLDGLLQTGDAVVQPYLSAIATRGELSVVVLDGMVSHAVRKHPVEGDFRVQEDFGGSCVPEQVDAEVAALARWVVDAVGTELLLARVDLVEDDDGTLQLLELEATEPDLYLTVVPDAAGRIADAILRRAS